MNIAKYQLWYVRRGSKVEGPYVEGLIRRRILLGRIRMDDELSDDQHLWRLVSELPELAPATVAAADDDPYGQERLAAAMRWADERSGENRRSGAAMMRSEKNEQRAEAGRRKPEPVELETYRALLKSRQRAPVGYQQLRSIKLVIAFVVVVIVGIVSALYFYQPHEDDDWSRCNMAVAPGINWSYCQAEGAQLKRANLKGALLVSINLRGADLYQANLAGADLSYANLALANLQQANLQQVQLKGAVLSGSDLSAADLRGADLSYANLNGADLTNSLLKGARLDHAVWFDGQLCKEGSVDGCKVSAVP
ncbi:MAG: pentapeptide repeat-containing protein [Gammaproteobacteria bacterium]|nr:pentapeptide repeat-containing protein [Gammaproteobacteria bacterium]